MKQIATTPIAAEPQFFLIGGGIASMAAAAFLIRDGGIAGRQITILEEFPLLGGSLDGAGSPENGYVLRGGRMLESKYLCTFDLFSSIPNLDKSKSVTQEIFDWNETLQTSSHSRLVRHGKPEDAPEFGLAEKHILALELLMLEPESLLRKNSIADHFEPSFFETNFWLMWCTTFAFQPWHSAIELKRYLLRFTHMVAGFNRLQGIMRTVYNQYDSLVLPLQAWLSQHGVNLECNTRVTGLAISEKAGRKQIEKILCQGGEIDVSPKDHVIVTLGSMTESSSLGSTDSAPIVKDKPIEASWSLWEKLAASHPELGRPSVFSSHVDESKWLSFTTTLHDPAFFQTVRDFTGNVPGEGGLITLADSPWLMSIVLPHQPHFIGQPDGVNVFWGYGLFIDRPGNFVRKPMSACTGREIMTELLCHFEVGASASRIMETATCIPCFMPFITSQFLRREKGDRPEIIPDGWDNFAVTGQFCEQPDDVVFTVEYSVRAAQTAVYKLLGLNREPPPVFKGQYNPRTIFEAFLALHDYAL